MPPPQSLPDKAGGGGEEQQAPGGKADPERIETAGRAGDIVKEKQNESGASEHNPQHVGHRSFQ